MLISVDEATPGMKLKDDVTLSNGITIFNKSSTLTENTINTIKKYQVTQISVEQVPLNAAPGSSASTKYDSPVDRTGQNPLSLETQPETIDANLPQIDVIIKNDRMSANLYIKPSNNENEEITIEQLKKVLFDHEIVFGVNESILTKVVKDWQQAKGFYEYKNVAKGMPYSPAKEGNIELTVKYMANIKDIDLVKEIEYCWEIAESTIPIQRVDQDTVIAQKGVAIPAIPGRDILGQEIVEDIVEKTKVNLDPSVEYDPQQNNYKSTITGLVYYANNTLGVLPVNFDGSAELIVSEDNMKADLIVHPPMEHGNSPSEKYLKSLIVDKNITYGIDDKKLYQLRQQLNKGIYPKEPTTIAEGMPPVHGQNGKVEYLFNPETSLVPKENSNGSVDYKDVSIIQAVKAGDNLAKLIAPTTGKKGKDLYGQEIPFVEGKIASLPIGANTQVHPEDEDLLIAGIDGNVRLNNHLIEIHDGFIVKGNVSYATGNINYEKSVLIKGDIKSGFLVKCGGDLEVGGTIEDSEIFVGGSILCRYGFSGQGKGLIKCDGNVNIGFMKNQTIRCRNHVIIAKEALNCTIFARNTINVMGRSLSIAGGHLIARDSIIANVIGNSSGIQTILEVGLDYTLLEELEKNEQQKKEIIENKKKLVQSLQKIENTLKFRRKLSAKDEYLHAKLKNTITKYENQVKVLEEREKIITKKMKDFGKSYIKVARSVMPGTLIKIGERHLNVHEEIIGPKTIRMVNFEIRVM